MSVSALAVITYFAIFLAAIITAFLVELLVVSLYPNISAPKQPLVRKAKPAYTGHHLSSIRQDVSFKVDGSRVSAWLYLPDVLSSPVPCIVMAHGLGATKNMALDLYATCFRDAGMAVLVFDYRHLGESEGEPRQLIWVPYQLQDYAAAVKYARSLKEVDGEKVALWGTSLSGGHALVTAANDHNIACVSVQCPMLDGAAAAYEQLRRLGISYALRMLAHAQRDLARSWLGLSPHRIPIVGKPGTIALMSDEDAWNTFAELASDDFINEACARIAISIGRYRPVSYLHRIQCPVLLQVCDYDFALPPKVADTAAKKLGQLAQVIHYPIGHFDIYHGEHFQTAVNHQIQFFKEHLF